MGGPEGGAEAEAASSPRYRKKEEDGEEGAGDLDLMMRGRWMMEMERRLRKMMEMERRRTRKRERTMVERRTWMKERTMMERRIRTMERMIMDREKEEDGVEGPGDLDPATKRSAASRKRSNSHGDDDDDTRRRKKMKKKAVSQQQDMEKGEQDGVEGSGDLDPVMESHQQHVDEAEKEAEAVSQQDMEKGEQDGVEGSGDLDPVMKRCAASRKRSNSLKKRRRKKKKKAVSQQQDMEKGEQDGVVGSGDLDPVMKSHQQHVDEAEKPFEVEEEEAVSPYQFNADDEEVYNEDLGYVWVDRPRKPVKDHPELWLGNRCWLSIERRLRREERKLKKEQKLEKNVKSSEPESMIEDIERRLDEESAIHRYFYKVSRERSAEMYSRLREKEDVTLPPDVLANIDLLTTKPDLTELFGRRPFDPLLLEFNLRCPGLARPYGFLVIQRDRETGELLTSTEVFKSWNHGFYTEDIDEAFVKLYVELTDLAAGCPRDAFLNSEGRDEIRREVLMKGLKYVREGVLSHHHVTTAINGAMSDTWPVKLAGERYLVKKFLCRAYAEKGYCRREEALLRKLYIVENELKFRWHFPLPNYGEWESLPGEIRTDPLQLLNKSKAELSRTLEIFKGIHKNDIVAHIRRRLELAKELGLYRKSHEELYGGLLKEGLLDGLLEDP